MRNLLLKCFLIFMFAGIPVLAKAFEQPVPIYTSAEFVAYFDSYEMSKNPLVPVSEDQCEIWLIRHGESESNAAINDKDKIRIAGRTVDSPLSEQGYKQAKEIAFLLKSKIPVFSAFYSSPMSRAMDTAYQIKSVMEADGFTQEIVQVEDLIETDFGDLDGSNGHTYDPYEVLMKQTLPLLPEFKERMDYRMVPNMESNKEVFARVEKVIKDLAKKHQGQSVCMTTHNGPLKAVFMHLAAAELGVDIMYHQFSVGNCAAICLESDGHTLRLKQIHKITMRQ